jgi:hypothetical protein
MIEVLELSAACDLIILFEVAKVEGRVEVVRLILIMVGDNVGGSTALATISFAIWTFDGVGIVGVAMFLFCFCEADPVKGFLEYAPPHSGAGVKLVAWRGTIWAVGNGVGCTAFGMEPRKFLAPLSSERYQSSVL